jgi:hypothetical protein
VLKREENSGHTLRYATATFENTDKSRKIRLLVDWLDLNSVVDTEVPCMDSRGTRR